MTWECASCRSPPPRNCLKSSCAVMNAPVRVSHRIDLSTTGENCWLTAPLSPPCWIACCITDTFSSASRAVGALKPAAPEKDNDKCKSKGKNKSDKDAGQK